MAVNYTPSLSSGLGPSPVKKSDMQAWLNEISDGIANLDPRATPIYASRTSAVSAAPGLPASLTHIMVREGTALTIRSRTASADDPLFDTGARWGVVLRLVDKPDLLDRGNHTGTQAITTVEGLQAALDDLQEIKDAAVAPALTVTPTGNGAAYTATGPTNIDNIGKMVVFTPDVTNTSGAPTLSINGGTARPILHNFGILGVGRLVPGVPVVLRRDGAGWRVVEGAEEGVPSVNTSGTATEYTGTLATHSLVGNHRLFVLVPHVTNGIAPRLSMNGAASVPLHHMDARVIPPGYFVPGYGYLCLWGTNHVRVIGAQPKDRDPALEHYRTAHGVAAVNLQREPLVQAGGETAQIVLTGASAETIWPASQGERGRTIQAFGTRWIDIRHLPTGAAVPYTIRVMPGATVKVFNAATVWTLPADTLVKVYKISETDILFDALTGSVTSAPFASDPPPAADLTIATAGQSLAKSFVRGAGLYGLQMGLRNYAPATKNLWVIDSAIGGTPLTSEAGAASAWWDMAANAPGPSALAWRDTVLAKPANQPAVGAIYLNNGQSDAGWMDTPMGGLGLTPAEFKSALQALISWMRAQLGNSLLPVILSPLGPEDNSAAGNQAQHAGVRWAQMQVIAEDANAHLGPAYYDLPRPFGDLHLPRESNMLMGWRLAAILSNVLYGTSHPTGPRVDKIEVLESGKRYRLRLAPHSASMPHTVPDDWSNLAILPSGTTPATGTPAVVDRTYWETISGFHHYNVVLRDATPGGTVMFPYGWGWELRAGRFPRNARIEGWGNVWPVQPIQSGAFG